MEMQEWDEPQYFIEQDMDNNDAKVLETNNDNIGGNQTKYNASYDKTYKKMKNNKNHNNANYKQSNNINYRNKKMNNNSYFNQRQYENNTNIKYYHYNQKKGNSYYIKKNVEQNYNHCNERNNHINKHSKKLNQYYGINNKQANANKHYVKKNVNANSYIYHPSHETHEQKEAVEMKSDDTNNINNVLEINKSNGTILYCPPKANKESDIITIKPYEIIPSKPNDCIRIITLGCTHELHNSVFYPNGDLLIHAGDICNWRRYNHTQQIYKTPYDIWEDFISLLNKIKNRKQGNFQYGMYVIPGNHDNFVEQNTNQIQKLLFENNIDLLINERETINICDNKTLSIFGSPISWYRSKPSNAYQIHRGILKYLWNKDDRLECNKHWDYKYINNNFQKSNILVCHGPCAGYGDCEIYGKGTGSYELLKYIKKIKPKLFICCDFHGNGTGTHGYGIGFLPFDSNNDFCICMNVAIAHQPARHMRSENVKRGVTIVDVRVEDLL